MTLKQIGETLKKKREDKKLSLDEIKSDTFISKKYLTALEEGRMEGFPAEVYYLGFMKRYAIYLKLNPEELISVYYNSIKQKNEENNSRISAASKSGKKTVLIMVTAALLLVAGAMFINMLRQSFITTIPVSEPAQEAAPAQPAKPAAGETRAKMPLNLEVSAFKNSWIKIVGDEQILFQGILYSGSKKEFQAREKLRLVVGYTKGIKAKLNGEPVDVIKNEKREVNEFIFTPKSGKQKI
jgi:cytoskeletal protein RodZ